jgi:hypothetical protein
LIVLQRLVDGICDGMKIGRDSKTEISAVWEGNSGTLTSANALLPNAMPKRFAMHCHRCREHAQSQSREISVEKIGTKEQKADALTKPLSPREHGEKRMVLVGWWLVGWLIAAQGVVCVELWRLSLSPCAEMGRKALILV